MRAITDENQYLDLLRDIRDNGAEKSDRTGTGTRSVFGRQLRFDLTKSFPLFTTKFVSFRLIKSELLWFLSGSSNIKPLLAQNNHIWDEWADEDGELGPGYGVQWRSWPAPDGETIDQITQTVDLLRTNPDSRRILVSAWNVAELDKMALVPCHVMFQFYVTNGKLSCQLYQRSADMFLGVPFNIASYALLTHMMAQQAGLEVGEFVWTSGDTHIYDNHTEQVEEQLSREPFPLPTLVMPSKAPSSIFEYKLEDFTVMNYNHHARIEAPIAV